jgi:hypothetical protein
MCPCCSERCSIRCRWRRRIRPSGALASKTVNCTRDPSICPQSHFSYGTLRAAFCSYAEDTPLSPAQFKALASEMDGDGTREAIFSELEQSLQKTRGRLEAIVRPPLDRPVSIGRKGLPTTLTGLLIHAAEHTQRHVGQAITTAKLIVAQRGAVLQSAAHN